MVTPPGGLEGGTSSDEEKVGSSAGWGSRVYCKLLGVLVFDLMHCTLTPLDLCVAFTPKFRTKTILALTIYIVKIQ